MDKQHIYEAILNAVAYVSQKQRTNKVYPHDVLGWLPFICSVWTVRRYMRDMAEQGMLIRNSYKGGYARIEK